MSAGPNRVATRHPTLTPARPTNEAGGGGGARGQPIAAVYDLADLDRSVGVLPAGNSGNPASPHWNDQAPLWLAGQTHPLPFSEAAVESATVALARLVPGTISG